MISKVIMVLRLEWYKEYYDTSAVRGSLCHDVKLAPERSEGDIIHVVQWATNTLLPYDIL